MSIRLLNKGNYNELAVTMCSKQSFVAETSWTAAPEAGVQYETKIHVMAVSVHNGNRIKHARRLIQYLFLFCLWCWPTTPPKYVLIDRCIVRHGYSFTFTLTLP